MSSAAVYQFPDYDTLEAVLLRVPCGLVSVPMEDVAVTCATELDAMVLRSFGLPIQNKTTLVVQAHMLPAVTDWIDASDLRDRYHWHHLERFEFRHAGDQKRLIEAFISITGQRPFSMRLDIWPEIFRSERAGL